MISGVGGLLGGVLVNYFVSTRGSILGLNKRYGGGTLFGILGGGKYVGSIGQEDFM